MKNEEIKERVHKIYESIKNYEMELDSIRKGCSHEKSSLCNYMWAAGHISAAHVCDYCGAVTKDATHEENVYLSGEGI